MKIYILTYCITYEGDYIEGVFSSRQLAEDFKITHNLKDTRYDRYIITEYEVDGVK